MERKLRICYIGDGRSIHTRRWVEHFARLGHDVHLITNWDVKFDSATVHLIEGTGTFNFVKRVFKARRLIRHLKPDIVHAHFVTDSGFIGAMSGFHPLVISPWGSDIVYQPEESAIFRFLVKYALKRADVVQCGDDTMVSRVRELVGGKVDVRRIGWGVDSDMFRPDRSAARTGVRFLYLRISHDKYRTGVLLEAMPEVLARHREARFVLLNSGEQLDRTRKAVAAMADRDRVEFMDPAPHARMPSVLNACDVYVDTVYSETPGCGIGITALEAMACGLPVCISDTAGHEVSVRHMESGYVYKGLDPKALAEALCALAADAGLRERLGANARAYVMKEQSWQNNMLRMEKVYMELAGRGEAR